MENLLEFFRSESTLSFCDSSHQPLIAPVDNTCHQTATLNHEFSTQKELYKFLDIFLERVCIYENWRVFHYDDDLACKPQPGCEKLAITNRAISALSAYRTFTIRKGNFSTEFPCFFRVNFPPFHIFFPSWLIARQENGGRPSRTKQKVILDVGKKLVGQVELELCAPLRGWFRLCRALPPNS